MPVVCRKIAYGQAAARQPISELLWQHDGRIQVAIFPGQSMYASSHETIQLRPFDRALRRIFERRLQ